ncbi:hypothetical protein TNCV_4720851 [Trichonephila clavipes]|uniref:Uncharacterized protein n=1 Tax=Trichonephila clavipes TaxID=2585209 RepID=A0A8X6W612_TRICX|nr:hypothetical protein TNCV_4720851 [Trichonephila clavipes]
MDTDPPTPESNEPRRKGLEQGSVEWATQKYSEGRRLSISKDGLSYGILSAPPPPRIYHVTQLWMVLTLCPTQDAIGNSDKSSSWNSILRSRAPVVN